MPTINEMQYGFDAAGIESYVEEVKAKSLEAAKEAAKETAPIKDALDQVWDGESKDKYFENLNADVNKFCEALDDLYAGFTTEVSNAAMVMKEHDKNMIK